MKVAAIQMVSATSLDANLQSAQVLLGEAAKAGAELAVLPEYFCLMGRKDTDKLAIQETFGHGQIQSFLSQTARALKMWIVGGTLPISIGSAASNSSMQESTRRRVYNTSLAFSPSGDCVARYDKIHLFKFDNGQEAFDESRVLLPGKTPVHFEMTDRAGQPWRIGMSVCYDLRFPELYRHYSQSGVDVLLVPSAFTYTTGEKHWDVLLRARAIENQAFVVAPAQGGVHENGRRTWGHSLLIDPWGEVLGERCVDAGVVCHDFVLARRSACHAKLPALSHRTM
jgi:deaminated glutathione amidase